METTDGRAAAPRRRGRAPEAGEQHQAEPARTASARGAGAFAAGPEAAEGDAARRRGEGFWIGTRRYGPY